MRKKSILLNYSNVFCYNTYEDNDSCIRVEDVVIREVIKIESQPDNMNREEDLSLRKS
jgi:hypothetical protein